MAYVPRLPGRIRDGQLVLANPVAWRSLLARHNGRDVFVTVTRQQHMHSPNQRKYYFAVVVDMIAGYIGESREETHELLKAKFLPKRDIELLDGKHLEMPPSTQPLTVEQFTEYINAIKVWAATFLGLSIPDANEVEAA